MGPSGEAIMGPGEEKRGDRKSADDEFEGRDLLVGRLPGSEGKPGAGAEQSPSATMSSQAGAHDEVMREILEAARAILARDALQNAAEQESETAEALKRETAALAQAVEAARGTLAEAAGFAARREEQASSGARVLTEGVAALDTRGTALDKLIRLTGRQAEATARQVNESARQAEAVTQGMAGLEETAQALDGSLGDHAENMSRFNREQRWAPLADRLGHWRRVLHLLRAGRGVPAGDRRPVVRRSAPRVEQTRRRALRAAARRLRGEGAARRQARRVPADNRSNAGSGDPPL